MIYKLSLTAGFCDALIGVEIAHVVLYIYIYIGLVIKKLIKELPEDDLQLVELRFFEKRHFKEIAEILEISEVNAKVRMYRLVERLKKSLHKIKI